MESTKIRIIVVEDHAPFRRFILSLLEKRPNFLVMCEVSDGLEAVEKAEELQADVILLDIGLSTLNGIEVARRISKLVPQSKIIFVSQESNAEIVNEAMSTGACGYVVKSQAARDLLAAIEAVCEGGNFVSDGV
jgi:DNA-binding NarL/FixJ family response regulator